MSEGLANGAVGPISALLIAVGLLSVALVDDVFDPLDQMELWPDERDELWTRLEVDEAALADLELVGHPVSVSYELTGAALPSSTCGKRRWLADVSRVRGGLPWREH